MGLNVPVSMVHTLTSGASVRKDVGVQVPLVHQLGKEAMPVEQFWGVSLFANVGVSRTFQQGKRFAKRTLKQSGSPFMKK